MLIVEVIKISRWVDNEEEQREKNNQRNNRKEWKHKKKKKKENNSYSVFDPKLFVTRDSTFNFAHKIMTSRLLRNTH